MNQEEPGHGALLLPIGEEQGGRTLLMFCLSSTLCCVDVTVTCHSTYSSYCSCKLLTYAILSGIKGELLQLEYG